MLTSVLVGIFAGRGSRLNEPGSCSVTRLIERHRNRE